ncbi:N-acetyltransferase [Oceanobacillus manasiensis]|uniref:N-acetyltransferase n=1 Tax=Oceanobacillus manasiensis TaxID=586413 RepID=UPI0005AA8F98|nr:N-acetyltransferase [Oceanobacillus manasiensis]
MIDKTAVQGENITIGSYVVIEKNVLIGNNVEIGNHVTIKEGTIISDNVVISDFSLLGKAPSSNNKMARKPIMDLDPLYIGENVKVGSHCCLYKGSTIHPGVLVADMASIREHVTVGANSIIGKNVMVENNTTIGDNVTIQTASYVTAHMLIEDEVFIGPCMSSSNDKYMASRTKELQGPILKKGAKIGNNASLLPGIVVGEKAIVGAGSVITKDVPASEVVLGNPGRKSKS